MAHITFRSVVGRESPLSFAQQGMWDDDRIFPGYRGYELATSLRLRGALDVGTLSRCLTEIVARHDVLRAAFVGDDEAPMQVIAEPFVVDLPLSVVEAGEPEHRWGRLVEEATRWASEPFDLSTGPMIRARLFRLDARDHVLVIVVHHLATDWWSSRVLVSELLALYESFAAGRASPLAALPMQYTDYVRWQRERLSGERLLQLVSFWSRHLDGRGEPSQRPHRPAAPLTDHVDSSHVLPTAIGDALTVFCRRERVTRFILFLLVLNLVMRTRLGASLTVATPTANRSLPGTEQLIGLFMDSQLLRVTLDDALTVREALGRVRNLALDAAAHAELPSGVLLAALRRRLLRERLPCHASLNVRLLRPLSLAVAGLRVDKVTVVPGEFDDGLPIALDVGFDGDRIKLNLSCATSPEGHREASGTGERLLAVLRQVLARPDGRVGDTAAAV